MMDGKEIEIAVVRDFFQKHYDYCLEDDCIKPPRENPDVEVSWQGRVYGIEVGAVVDQRTLLLSSQAQRFLDQANAELSNHGLPKDICIALVMQDERETVRFTPSISFGGYKYIPRFLAGFFVWKPTREGSDQIVLNQSSSSRPDHDLFPKNQKEIVGLVSELCQYVLLLTDNDFSSPTSKWPVIHHARTVESSGQKQSTLSRNFLSKKVGAKLNGEVIYREREFDELILLLHNRFDWNNTNYIDIFYPFWHYHSQIIEYLRRLLETNIYDAVYFVDYSERLFEAVLHRLDM